ncbi:hypothetical protein D5b_00234 [Faustovirus]|nr:hypothetical protein D5b_00234 [Faustovirus]AMN84680.1 hypothetical protein D6_00277 [Faustovirus]AMP44186.1 hypothetical protein PRJ_Dakar_00230 [Faustovirus]
MAKTTNKYNDCGVVMCAIGHAIAFVLSIVLIVGCISIAVDNYALQHNKLHTSPMCSVAYIRGCGVIRSDTIEINFQRARLNGNVYEQQYVVFESHTYNCSVIDDPVEMYKIACVYGEALGITFTAKIRKYDLANISHISFTGNYIIACVGAIVGITLSIVAVATNKRAKVSNKVNESTPLKSVI